MRRSPSLIAGAVLVVIIIGGAIIGLVWTPWDPTYVNVLDRLQGPSASHWFGTDALGRDVFSQIIVGARTTLWVGVVAVAVAALIGVPLGIAAAMLPRIFGELMSRGLDLLLAFPALLLAIMFTAIYGGSTEVAMIAIGISTVPIFARVIRSGTLQILHADYITAARAAGRGQLWIAVRHVLPGVASLIIVQASVSFAIAILAEAALSFLGLGTPPPTPSWGRMLSESQQLLFVAPRLAIIPGVAIALAVLGFNLLGDGLRGPSRSATGTGEVIDMPDVLTVQDLNVHWGGTPLVSEVSFSVAAGERVGLIGESGSGKSLTALSAIGLLPQGLRATGSITLGEHRWRAEQAKESQLAKLRGETASMVFQEPMTALNPTMRVGEQVAEVMLIHHTVASRTKARARAIELLDQVGLPDPEKAARAYPHQLSGGQRQRVVIAIALANHPSLLICDEPTTALDVTVQARILDQIVKGVEAENAALLLITHDLAVVATVCERVLVMKDGVIVESGPVGTVLRTPNTRGPNVCSPPRSSRRRIRLPKRRSGR